MLKRKICEILAAIYRNIVFPFIRIGIEIRTKSVMRSKSYVKGTTLGGRNYLGKNTVLKNCTLGFGSVVHNNGDLADVDIGRYTGLAANVSTVIGKHPISKHVAMLNAFTLAEKIFGYTYTDKTVFDGSQERTQIGNDVWIGNNVLIMGGVKIGDGAVIGAGSVVTKDIEPYSINAGVPAKIIRYRFEKEQIQKLLEMKWWDRDEAWIRENIHKFADIEEFLK